MINSHQRDKTGPSIRNKAKQQIESEIEKVCETCMNNQFIVTPADFLFNLLEPGMI